MRRILKQYRSRLAGIAPGRGTRLLLLIACSAAVIATAIAAFGLAFRGPPERATAAPAVLGNDAYIWQRQWSAAIPAVMARSAPAVQRWHILAAQWERTGNGPLHWTAISPDWAALRAGSIGPAAPAGPHVLPVPVVMVFRIDGRVDGWDPASMVANIAARVAAWRAEGVPVAGVEIDYDCATSRLPAYTQFLRTLRRAVPDVTLAITALPTWLDSPALDALLAVPDESILQVHAVLNPLQGLFDPERAHGWLRAYSRRTSHPWRVALPAYGTRVFWRENGSLAGTESERPMLQGSQGTQGGQELIVEPEAVAAFVAAVVKAPFAGLRGFVWFRLPLDTDSRAWSVATWLAVMQRAPLRPMLRVGVVPDADAALYDVVVSSDGNIDAALPQTIVVPANCSAADGINGYVLDYDKRGTLLRRMQPGLLHPGVSRRIGWARCAANNNKVELHVES